MDELREYRHRIMVVHEQTSKEIAGLPSALTSLADRFNTIFDVTLEIDKSIAEQESPMKPSLYESLRVGLYRVAEGALSNVAKHSQTTKSRVSLSLSPAREVLLMIRDDSQGFEAAGVPSGQGLLSMEDYVTALGATLELSSSLGMGTTLRASVPVSCRRSSLESH